MFKFKRTKKLIRSAISYNYIKESTVHTFRIIKGITSRSYINIPKKNNKGKISSLNITDKQIADAKKTFNLYCYIYSILCISIFGYGILELLNGYFLTFLISLSASATCLALLFKYHFWLVQIKYDILGLTFKEWWDIVFKSKKI